MTRFAAQGQGGPAAEDRILAILTTYVATCDEAGLDSLLVVSQLLLETDNLTSASSRLGLNPVKLDLTTVEGDVSWFSTWREAARAHAGLLLAYALPAGSESAAQLDLVEEALRWRPVPHRLRGSAPTLDHLGDSWVADSDYTDKVLRIADSITMPQH